MSKENNLYGQLIILTGPSGAGKTAVAEEIKKRESSISRIVTYCADRGPREGEKDGVDYNFISREQYQIMISQGKFLEDNCVENSGVKVSMKATGRGELEEIRRGKTLIWIIDSGRAADIKEYISEKGYEDIAEASTVFYIGVPSIKEMNRRQKLRDGEKYIQESAFNRIRAEWKIWKENQDKYDRVIINECGKLGETVDKIFEVAVRK